MDQVQLLKLQTERGAKATGYASTARTLEAVTNECRKRIEEKSEQYRDLNPVDKKEAIRSIIIDYVMNTKPVVEGYVDSENQPDTLKLVNKLIESITDYDILTNAMNDESIFEIRANGKEIKVERKGHVEDLRDGDGNIVSFDSPEQQEIILRKMLGDVRLTPKDALVNGSTIEGYRIAAVHNSATSPDPNDPTAAKYHSFVLRKFNKTRLTLSDIVKKHTMSDNMARFMSLFTAGGLTYFVCGPTASGKTVTSSAILQTVPPTTRTVIIQNPSEIDLRFKDATGRVYNDVLHLEANDDIQNPAPSDPTAENLMDHTLRLSPTFCVFGELRTDLQFKQATKFMLAGHSLTGTYHSSSAEGAISRYLTAYLAEAGNQPAHLALRTLTTNIDMIVIQKILRDGTRKVLQVSEVLGVDPNNENKPLINDIYKFIIDSDPEIDEAGNVKRIIGHHKRVGKLSNRLLDKFQIEGVSKARYAFLLEDVNDDEIETYTGENILNYNI